MNHLKTFMLLAALTALFVGIGYCVLWYFEDGTRTAQRDPPVNPPAGGA